MVTAAPVKFSVITPERRVIDSTADTVVFMAHDGEIGILPGRSPLMCELGIGQVRYDAGGKTQRIFINRGFAQVIDNEVSILTPQAIPAEAITNATIEQAEAEIGKIAGTAPDDVAAREDAQERVRVLRRLQSAS